MLIVSARALSSYHRQFNAKREKGRMARRQSCAPMKKLRTDEAESHIKTLKPNCRKSLGHFLDRRRQSIVQVLNGLRVKSQETSSSPEQLQLQKQLAEKTQLYNQKYVCFLLFYFLN